MRGTKKKEGLLDQWSRSTVVLAKRDGDWRIVHEHN
jgi:ketosteroid isomerase-like protein